MNIKSVHLKNFRLFENLYLTFDKVSGLVGENGEGKTTILEAINYVTTKQGLSYKLNDSDFRSGCSAFSIEVKFDSLFFCTIPDGYHTKDIPCDGVVLSVSRRKRSGGKALNDGFVVSHICTPIVYDNINTLGLSAELISDSPIKVEMKNQDRYEYEAIRKGGTVMEFSSMSLGLAGKVKEFPNVFYFDKNREKQANKGFSTTFQKTLDDLNWRYISKLKNNQEVNGAWNDYYEPVVNLVEDTKDDRVVVPLKDKLNTFFGTNKYDNLQISLLNLYKPFDNGFFSIKDREQLEQISIGSFGSGEGIMLSFYLLKIISELSKEEIIFLIDEPELHLHPQAQLRLYNEFISGDVQIIYATHSDLLVSLGNWKYIKRITSASIFPNETSLSLQLSDNRTIETHLGEVNQYYQDKSIFFRENNELFFSKKILLVEGPADKYGLPILAQKLGFDFSNISIISCNGKEKIKYYIAICKAFGINTFAVFDLDGQPITETENNIIIGDSSGECVYFTNSFELELGVNGNADHKASKCLTKIDEIENTEDISQNIKSVISNINARKDGA